MRKAKAVAPVHFGSFDARFCGSTAKQRKFTTDENEVTCQACKDRDTLQLAPTGPVIALPELGGGLEVTAATIVNRIVNRRVVFVTLAYQSDSPNPLEDGDGMGHIQSFGQRHTSRSKAEAGYEALRTDPDAVALSYFEHGNCQWFVRHPEQNANIPDFQWDGVDVAGVWTPDDCLRDAAKDDHARTRATRMREWAAQACETYTSWCNGEVYGYIIEVYDVRLADDGEVCEDRAVYHALGAPLYEDACWDNVGSEWALKATREAVNNIPAEYVGTFNVTTATA